MKASLNASQLNKLSACRMGHPYPSPTCRRKLDIPLPTVLLYEEATNKYHRGVWVTGMGDRHGLPVAGGVL